MRENVRCAFPVGYDDSAILERLAQVLHPELDEPIFDLSFVRSMALRSGHASVALRLPTSGCAPVMPTRPPPTGTASIRHCRLINLAKDSALKFC